MKFRLELNIWQEEAEMLCQKSACYDLLNRMYQASNQWDKALELALTKDRVNLKRTYYNYAHHLENQGSSIYPCIQLISVEMSGLFSTYF